MHKFVFENWEKYEQLRQDLDESNVDIFGLIVHEYQLYLRQHKEREKGDDEFMRTSYLFLHMSDNFTKFVLSYRSADAIGIEQGH